MSRRFWMRLGILALMVTELGTQFAYAQSLNCSHRQSQVPATTQNTEITIAAVELSGKRTLFRTMRAHSC